MKPTSIILMSDTSDIINETGATHRGAGYYGFNSGLHTVGLYLNHFIGRISIQGSLETNPEDSDWFNIDFQGNGEEYKEYPITPIVPESDIIRNELDYLLNCNNVNQQNITSLNMDIELNAIDIKEITASVNIDQQNEIILDDKVKDNTFNIQRLEDGNPILPPISNPLIPAGTLPVEHPENPLINNPIFTSIPAPLKDEFFTGVEMFSFEGNYIWIRAVMDRSYLPESMYTYDTGGKAIKTDRIGNVRQILLGY